MTGFAVYKLYYAISNHFNTKYDFHLYKGKIKCSENKYIFSRDRYQFDKLAGKIKNGDQLLEYIVSFFLYGKSKWIGDIFSDDFIKFHQNRLKNVESITYIFKNDMSDLLIGRSSPNDIIKIDNTYPIIFKSYLNKTVCLETLCILNCIINYVPYLDNKLGGDFLWDSSSKMIKKYTPFLQLDMVKMKKILRNIIS